MGEERLPSNCCAEMPCGWCRSPCSMTARESSDIRLAMIARVPVHGVFARNYSAFLRKNEAVSRKNEIVSRKNEVTVHGPKNYSDGRHLD